MTIGWVGTSAYPLLDLQHKIQLVIYPITGYHLKDTCKYP